MLHYGSDTLGLLISVTACTVWASTVANLGVAKFRREVYGLCREAKVNCP